MKRLPSRFWATFTAIVLLVLFGLIPDRLSADEPAIEPSPVPEALRTFWLSDRIDHTFGAMQREQQRYLISEKKVFYQALEGPTDTEVVTMEFDIIGHFKVGANAGELLLRPVVEETVGFTFDENGAVKTSTESTVPEERWWMDYQILESSAALLECDRLLGEDEKLADDESFKKSMESARETSAKIKALPPEQRPKRPKNAAEDGEAFFNLAELRRIARDHKEFKKGSPAAARDALAKAISEHRKALFDKFYNAPGSSKNGLTADGQAWPLAYRAGMLASGYDPSLSTISFTQGGLVKSAPEGLEEEEVLALYIVREGVDEEEWESESKAYVDWLESLREPFESSLKKIVAGPGSPDRLPSFSKEEDRVGDGAGSGD